jgi:hypothetical protein
VRKVEMRWGFNAFLPLSSIDTRHFCAMHRVTRAVQMHADVVCSLAR